MLPGEWAYFTAATTTVWNTCHHTEEDRSPGRPAQAQGARRGPATPVNGSSLFCGRSEVPLSRTPARNAPKTPRRLTEAPRRATSAFRRAPQPHRRSVGSRRPPRLGTARPGLRLCPLLSARQGAKTAPASASKPPLRGAGRAGRGKAGNSLLTKKNKRHPLRSSLLRGLVTHLPQRAPAAGFLKETLLLQTDRLF